MRERALRLNSAEMRAVLKSVEVLQGDPSVETLGSRIGEAVRRAIACEFASIDTFTYDGAMAAHLWANRDWEDQAPKHVDRFLAHIDQHPFFQPARVNRLAAATRVSDVIPLTAFRRLEIYDEFFRVVGIDRQMAIGISHTAITSVALSRCGRDFSESDRRLLQALKPHFMSAMVTSECLAELKAQRDLFASAEPPGAGSIGVIGVSRTGGVRFISRSAEQLLEARGGRSWILPPRIAEWLKHCMSRRDLREFPHVVAETQFAGPGQTLTATLACNTEHGHVLLLKRGGRNSAECLCSVSEGLSVGLTARETEILQWVERGMGNQDIAVLCASSVRTVHKHLEHVFEKLNVENRAAAVRKVRDLLKQPTPPLVLVDQLERRNLGSPAALPHRP
jgi:DNA-binding CsgD family transcriptional regulator